MADRRTQPRATYRLQFNRTLTFADATALVPYLARLGISHCYASPYLKARSGSSHGYDIVDHTALNPEIGDRPAYDAWVDALRAREMGHILDLVPNHMGVGGSDNRWWLDVLENGPASPYAHFFDIDWRPSKDVLRGKVLVPVLGEPYGSILETGDLTLRLDAEGGEFNIWYYDHRFPVDPSTYPMLLEPAVERLAQERGGDDPLLQDLQALVSSFGHLPPRWDQREERLQERRRDKEVRKRQLAALYAREPAIAAAVDATLALYNGNRDDPASFAPLHRLIEQQAYRPAYWKVASDEINYRRFFDINDLAGLRVELPDVLDTTHALAFELLAGDRLDGLRIDHPDGLYDPAAYYAALRERIEGDFYLVVEKILAVYEHLPESWPVEGTTGYDFANLVGGLFVYPGSEHDLDRLYARVIGRRIVFDDLLFENKKLVIRAQLSSELTVLANLADQIAQSNRHTRDFTLNGLRDAITLVVAAFPVYRTYVDGRGPLREEDRRYIDWAVAWAKKRSPAMEVSIFDFLRDLLLGEFAHDRPEQHDAVLRFAMKLQQFSAPVMAKGLEDTSFYIYNRLVSLNEVGGDPRRFGTTPGGFHRACQERRQRWPHGLLATSTHDSKRSEDLRVRIHVLSEIPGQWQHQVGRWTRINRSRKTVVDDLQAPSRNDEYLLYQTLVGAWPLEGVNDATLPAFRDRIREYMLKAAKEAKQQTSWVNPNAAYEAAIGQFVDQLLADGSNRFLADLEPFALRIAHFGLLNALSQLVLKLTAPGVPDIYQGCELWDFSLVDPDNRRPVDYGLRARLLDELVQRSDGGDLPDLAHELAASLTDGRAKLYTVWRLLTLRGREPGLFAQGSYLPLTTSGHRADHVVAFARDHADRWLLVVVARWFARLLVEPRLPLGPAVWGDTLVELPSGDLPGEWRDCFTGERFTAGGAGALQVAELLRHFPVAVLAGDSGGPR
jgi:(1->4)-alpha-D-glucan 1-alpha-D-glucosylmutase